MKRPHVEFAGIQTQIPQKGAIFEPLHHPTPLENVRGKPQESVDKFPQKTRPDKHFPRLWVLTFLPIRTAAGIARSVRGIGGKLKGV